MLEGAEREVVQAPVQPSSVVDTVAPLFEVFKDDTRLLEPTAPLHNLTAHFVETVTDESFFASFQCVVDAVLSHALDTLPHREVPMALELDLGEVDD